MQKQIYEKHIHDDPDFPFFFHVRMQAVPYSPDLFHWHESIELLYVLEGTLQGRVRGGSRDRAGGGLGDRAAQRPARRLRGRSPRRVPLPDRGQILLRWA